MSENTENLNIKSADVLLTPNELKETLALSNNLQASITRHRKALESVLDGNDKRLFLVVGPCSIHDTDAALDYAKRLKKLADQVNDSIIIVMRVYFEKPRTTTGWKGLINDPHLNDSFDITAGLFKARTLMIKLAELGLPIATEALDPISPQYLGDLISWNAIGARTTESQTHREMASGLSGPVGFKNGTDGNLKVATDALQAINSPHSFLGINRQGQVSIIRTKGNSYGHIVLRGGGGKPNYQPSIIEKCESILDALNLAKNIVIDCSHENSSKDPANQEDVFNSCINQRLNGHTSIIGLMLESNINWGNQKIPTDLSKLSYGVSVTDACIDWKTTERIIKNAHQLLRTS